MQVTSHHYVVGLMILIKNSSTGIKQSAKVGRSHILDDSYPSYMPPLVFIVTQLFVFGLLGHTILLNIDTMISPRFRAGENTKRIFSAALVKHTLISTGSKMHADHQRPTN